MRAALIVLFVLLAETVNAQTPMKSIGFMSPEVSCARSTSDLPVGPDGKITDLMPLDGAMNMFAPPAVPGSRPRFLLTFPTGDFSIRKVCISHWINGSQDNAYAVAGHWGQNGDHISPMIGGSQTQCTDFPADAPVVFAQGEYIDVHAGCQGRSHWITLHIWYTQP